MRTFLNQTSTNTTHKHGTNIKFDALKWIEKPPDQAPHQIPPRTCSPASSEVSTLTIESQYLVDTPGPQRFGPIMTLSRSTPIRLHKYLRQISLPSLNQQGIMKLSKSQILKILEVEPLLVIKGKTHLQALNHGPLINRFLNNPELKPEYLLVREVIVKPATIEFFFLLFDLYVSHYGYHRARTRVRDSDYLQGVFSVLSNGDRATKALQQRLEHNHLSTRLLAEFIGMDRRSGQ